MGQSAFGTLLKRGDGGAPEVFTAIAECLTISGVNLKRDTYDGTHHGSPGMWEEVILGIKRSGEIQLSLQFLPANDTQDFQVGLGKDLDTGTKRNFQLVFTDPAATTFSFAAFVTAFSVSAPHDGKLMAEVTIKLTGQPTLT